MTPWLLELLEPPTPFGDGFGYPLLIRGVAAFAAAFFFLFCVGRRGSAWLYRRGMRDSVRDYDEFFGRSKSGTPTMGGLLIVAAIAVAALIFSDLRSGIAAMLLLTTLWYGSVGAVDDFLKVRRGSSEGGLSRGAKLLLQTGFALFLAILVASDGSSPFSESYRTHLFFPFPGPDVMSPIDLGWFYVPFVVFAIVAIANAINFADGLDGLATLPCSLAAAVFALFAYLMWHSVGRAFDLVAIAGMQEIVVYGAAVAGACFGFLWFNGYPAQIFMGDTGSQALGGTLGAMAVLCKQELLFVIAGGVFVYEAFSVLFQDYVGIRLVGRRFFLRAPAHHSFQYRGVAETKVVLRFWIASLLCAVLSVATLKLR